jgi:hypothetical protein
MSTCKHCGVKVLWCKTKENTSFCVDVDKVKAESFPDPHLIRVFDVDGNLNVLSEVNEGYWLHQMTCEAYRKTKRPRKKKVITKSFIASKRLDVKIPTTREFKIGQVLKIKRDRWLSITCIGQELANNERLYLFE